MKETLKDMKKYKKDLIKLIYVWTEWKNIQISNQFKIERIIIWSTGTLSFTLLTTLFTIVYRAG